MALIQKNGIWYWSPDNDPLPAALYSSTGLPISGLPPTYWSPDNNPLTVTNPAALSSSTGSLISGLSTGSPSSPPISDVVDPRSITFTLAGSPGVNINVVEDGGKLDFTLTTTLKADLSGLFFDFTNSKLSTLSVAGPQITQFMTQAGGVMNLANGVNLNGLHLPNFDVGMEFGLAGIGSNHQNIQSESFVLSDKAHDLSINDLHPTGEAGFVGVRDLSVGQKLAAVAPYAPTATPDTVKTLEDTPITIQASSLATDLNSGAVLKVDKIGTGAQGPQYGTVQINNDGSLTYTPTTLDYEVNGNLTGNQDAFQVGVKDNFGGTVTSFVTVNATPVADKPTVNVTVLSPEAGDPINEVRLMVTAQSGDDGTVNQGSDFIQSIGLNLTGNVTTGTTITDSDNLLSGNTINASSNNSAPGRFTDEVDLLLPANASLPANTSINDTLAVTATAAETELPLTTATSTAFNQTIGIDNAQSSQDVTFQTSGQSIWDTGAGFSSDFSKFLGFDKSFSTGTSGTVGALEVSGHVRTGIEADLKITAGDISATLPFSVGLDSTYNVTTDTLQIVATDTELGGGQFTAHGPNGTLAVGLDLGFKGDAKATIAGFGPSTQVTFGSFTKPITGFSVKKSTTISTGVHSTHVNIPGVGSLTVAFPTVNTTGSNSSPGTISGTGKSNDMVNFTGDILDIASALIGGGSFNDDFFDKDGNQWADLLDLGMSIGLNLVQKFDLNSSGLTPALLVDGHPEPLSLDGTPLTIANASSLGSTPFDLSLGLVPQATLTNKTSIGANMNVSITAGQVSFGILGSLTALKTTSLNIPLGTLPPIYSNSFGLNGFGQQTVTQHV